MSLRSLSPVGTPTRLRTVVTALRGSWRKGDRQRDLAGALAGRLHAAACLPVSSGRAALTLILQTLREQADPERDEVVIPAYTCFSVPSAVVRAGLKVVPCDIDPRHLDFDQAMLPGLVSSRTLCIVPNHLFGFPARMNLAMELARAHGAYVVEDAAQALGARLNGGLVGTLGDVGFLSLGRGKPLTAIGGGVIVIPRSGELEARLRDRAERLPRAPRLPWPVVAQAVIHSLFLSPRLFGLAKRMPFARLGESKFSTVFDISALSPFQAALALAALDEQSDVTATRRANARILLEGLRQLPDLEMIEPVKDGVPVYLRLPLRASGPEARERLYYRLAASGLGTSRMYPSDITAIHELRTQPTPAVRPCAQAAQLAVCLLTLPTHPLVTARDLDEMVACIRRAGAR